MRLANKPAVPWLHKISISRGRETHTSHGRIRGRAFRGSRSRILSRGKTRGNVYVYKSFSRTGRRRI